MKVAFQRSVYLEIPQRLDRWLKKTYPKVNYAFIQKLIRTGKLRVNGQKQTGSYLLANADQLTCSIDLQAFASDPSKDGVLTSQEECWIESMILFEDKDLLVISKPYGLSCQGGTGLRIHVDDLFRKYAKSRALKNPSLDARFFLVHRLDRSTTGVLILAKNLQTSRYLSHLFKTHEVQKTYLAIVQGIPKLKKGLVSVPIAKSLGSKDKEVVLVDFIHGKTAQTYYEILQKDPESNLSLLRCKPLTGRTHQIRVHLSYIGCPILGDYKYGYIGETHVPLFLHSESIQFLSKDRVPLQFRAPILEHFEKEVKKRNFII